MGTTFRSLWLSFGVGSIAAIATALPAMAQPNIVLPRNRSTSWLEVTNTSGNVTVQPIQQTAQPARIGDRLVDVGDTIETGAGSRTRLIFDRDIGSVLVRENSMLTVDTLLVEDRGGRITHLSVPQGTATLQVRRFNNPNSRLTIATPAGIAGVRGTVFGVGVDPSGKTAVATESGAVAIDAAGESILIEPNFYSLVEPGQPPSPPQSLADTDLNLELLELIPQIGSGTATSAVRVVARVHPINVAIANGTPTEVDLKGNLDTTIPLAANRRLTLVLRSPLGKERTYEISVPARGWNALSSNASN